MPKNSRSALPDEFRDYYLRKSLPALKIGLTLTTLFFALLIISNYFIFSEPAEHFFFRRFGLILPIFLISILITYFRRLIPYLQPIFIVLNLLVCPIIFLVGYKADLNTPGYDFFFSWVMLLVFGLFTFYRLHLRDLLIIGGFQILSFILTITWNGTLTGNPSKMINSLFFIVAGYSLAAILSIIIEKLNWKNFIHRKALSAHYQNLLNESKTRWKAEEALRNNENQLHDILDAIPDWIYVVDEQYRIVMLNSSLKSEHERQGYYENCIGKKITTVYPLISKKALQEFDQIFRHGQMILEKQDFELVDRKIHGEVRKVPIFKDQKVVQIITIMRDRSREQEIEDLKSRNIQQKEMMIREIHHRVKNNLAIVIGLLTLQQKLTNNDELKRIIRDIEMRIRSMALIHEHLYLSENFEQVPIEQYLASLASNLGQVLGVPRVHLVTDLTPALVSIDVALPVGIITNELVTNAFKYAFPSDHGEGIIRLELSKKTDDELLLIISDNGIGLPVNFNIDNIPSMGLFIVRLLVEQLEGKIEIVSQEGTLFRITFKNQATFTQKSN